MFLSPQNTTTGFVQQNSMTYVFVTFLPPYWCSSEGHQHGVFIRSLINLSETFFQIPPAQNIAQTWIFPKLFEYSSPFIPLILDFICFENCFDDGGTVKPGDGYMALILILRNSKMRETNLLISKGLKRLKNDGLFSMDRSWLERLAKLQSSRDEWTENNSWKTDT